MAYCPDDGTEMEAVLIAYHACYQCPYCGVHWFYSGDEGTYVSVAETCPNCNQEVSGD